MTIPILPEKPESSQTPETPFLSNKVSAPKVSASKPILLLVGGVVIAVFMHLYLNNEEFQKTVDNGVGQIISEVRTEYHTILQLIKK